MLEPYFENQAVLRTIERLDQQTLASSGYGLSDSLKARAAEFHYFEHLCGHFGGHNFPAVGAYALKNVRKEVKRLPKMSAATWRRCTRLKRRKRSLRNTLAEERTLAEIVRRKIAEDSALKNLTLQPAIDQSGGEVHSNAKGTVEDENSAEEYKRAVNGMEELQI